MRMASITRQYQFKILLTNIGCALETSKKNQLDELGKTAPNEGSARDKVIAKLEEELESVKDGRNEDRFIFLLAAVIGFDVYIFSSMTGWAGQISILVLELLFLIVAGDRLGSDVVKVWVDKALNSVSRKQN